MAVYWFVTYQTGIADIRIVPAGVTRAKAVISSLQPHTTGVLSFGVRSLTQYAVTLGHGTAAYRPYLILSRFGVVKGLDIRGLIDGPAPRRMVTAGVRRICSVYVGFVLGLSLGDFTPTGYTLLFGVIIKRLV